MTLAAFAIAAAISHYPTTSGELECFDYDLFYDVVARSGGRVTQTIETPSFPTFTRLIIVTVEGTKQVFGGHADCILVPPLFVDHPDDLENFPIIDLILKPGEGA